MHDRGSRCQEAIGELFVEALCAEAGLVALGSLVLTGPSCARSASDDRNRGYASIVEEILDEAEQTDRAEDEQFGDARDELPERLRTVRDAARHLGAAKERMQAERAACRDEGGQIVADVELELAERFVTWAPEGHGFGRACRALDTARPRGAGDASRSSGSDR